MKDSILKSPALSSLLSLLLSVLSAACALSAAAETQKLPYPEARRAPQTDTYHGVKVEDPYRWLEDIDSPEATAWVKAEQKLTQDYLQAIPGRERVKSRLSAVWNFPRWTAPERHGDLWVFTRNDGLQNQPVLYVARTPEDEPRV